MALSSHFPARQQGMSMLSALVALSLGIFVVLIGLKMVPVYLENLSISEVLESVSQDTRSRAMSRAQLRDNIMRRLNINGVRDLPKEEIEFERTRQGLEIVIDYEVRKPIAGNVSVVMAFKESVVIPRND